MGMESMSLMDKIRQYTSRTNKLDKPVTEEEKELFNKIINKDNISNYSALDLAELRQFANEMRASEVKHCISFYQNVAKQLGIRCIDSDSDTNGEIFVGTHIQKDEVIEEDAIDITAEVETAELEDVEQEEEDVSMQSDDETIPIPKISLSNATLDRLIEAINILKETHEVKSETKKQDYKIIESVKYTEEERDEDVIGIPFSKVKNAVIRGMNVIYRGVPGCGKTHAAKCDAKAIIGFRESNRIKQIDFTENLDYSDTMVGLRQQENGRWQYIKGEIAEFCEFASQNSDSVFVLILNEFTRANTEAVLGQMFTAMENKYRGDEFILDSGDKFICPKNLVVLATMNGTDRGVKKLDKATEERFYIIDVEPLWGIWAKGEDDFVELLIKLDIYSGTEEEKIVRDICVQMNEINKKCLDGGILTIDSQIGQRQLMQFIGQNDISGNKIKYDKETLDIVIEQLINRATPMIDMCNSIEVNIEKLKKLVV